MTDTKNNSWESEVRANKRFNFGSNWKQYASTIDEARLQVSENQLSEWLGDDLAGNTFLDIGCGSGIHSLAAIKLGMDVHSFDFDADSFECTQGLKEKFGIPNWDIQQGSVLDKNFMDSIPKHDIVYSWGVLHHTGSMWEAIENSIAKVADNGRFFIAIYNKQGWKSKFWWYIKYIYNKLPSGLDKFYGVSVGYFFHFLNIVKYTLLLKPMVAIRPMLNYRKHRGMNQYYDTIDWMGGFPYEYATYEELKTYFKENGFEFEKGLAATSLECHQIVFKKVS